MRYFLKGYLFICMYLLQNLFAQAQSISNVRYKNADDKDGVIEISFDLIDAGVNLYDISVSYKLGHRDDPKRKLIGIERNHLWGQLKSERQGVSKKIFWTYGKYIDINKLKDSISFVLTPILVYVNPLDINSKAGEDYRFAGIGLGWGTAHDWTFGVNGGILNTKNPRFYADFRCNVNVLLPASSALQYKIVDEKYYAPSKFELQAGVTYPLYKSFWVGLGAGFRYVSVAFRDRDIYSWNLSGWQTDSFSKEYSLLCDGSVYYLLPSYFLPGKYYVISLGVNTAIGAKYDKRILPRFGFYYVF